MRLQTLIFSAAALLVLSINSSATPRGSIVDTFNDAARGTSRTADDMTFTHPKPQGWDSPSFHRAADDLHNSVRQYNITTPRNPHNPSGNFPPPPSM